MADLRVIECVPNFSEGRDKKILDQIATVIRSVEGVELKDIDPGEATNRTVFTFVGAPDAVCEAAFRAIEKAAQIIDMRKHKGTHPRMGATDVCPLIPVANISMEETAEFARKLAERVGTQLHIPIYLYEYAASSCERRNLAYLRKGEYESLPEKLVDPKMKPDFGPAHFDEHVAKTGATVVGARDFLIAYNIDLNTTNKDYATDIAFELREKGRSARACCDDAFSFRGDILRYENGKFPCGNCDFVASTLDELEAHTLAEHNYSVKSLLEQNDVDSCSCLAGKPVKKAGIFKCCKAIGWFVEDYRIAQISINLTNYKITATHDVYEAAKRLAEERGLSVTGSEIVGLVPFDAIIETGKFYLRRQDRSTGIPWEDIVHIAVRSLGLNDAAKFDMTEKILGAPKIADNALAKLTVKGFVDEVSRESPAPGGGSVAALAGSVGAALAAMVANLTADKNTRGEFKTQLITIAEKAQAIKDALLFAIDDDTQAFNDYLTAIRMPKNSAAEKSARDAAIQAGLKKAVDVPLTTAKNSLDALKLCAEIAEIGNRASVSDAGVGASIALTGVIGGCLNVLINLKDITDNEFKVAMREQCAKLESDAHAICDKTLARVKEIIAG